ncbi:MAG: hypothetical protein U9Q34_03155, partial [Elusimicrobiota bacterium]|nr:hypothetical protein [Elusimicrobiota bacterium]
SFNYPINKHSRIRNLLTQISDAGEFTREKSILSLIKSLMKNSDKDREYIIQTAKSLSNQLRKK